VIFANCLPGFKGLVRRLAASRPAHYVSHVIAFVGAFVLHQGTMSCTQAATVFRQRRRNVATLTRFLVEVGHSPDVLGCLRAATRLLEDALAQPGELVFVLDATKRHSQGQDPENSYSCGNTKRKAKGKGKGKQYKFKPRRCHSFVCGLLLTPGGLRLPYCRPYLTQEYCAQTDQPFYTDAELAARMVLDLQADLPEGARVVVVGDTAYDAQVVQAACDQRGYLWVVPANPERVRAVQPSTFRLTPFALKALAKANVPAAVLARLAAALGERVLRRAELLQEAPRAVGEADWGRYHKPLLTPLREKRVKLRELPQELSGKSFEPVRLSLAEDAHRLQRRLSASRGGPGKYPRRTYWVHRRAEDVQSVGLVVLLFSNKTKPGADKGKADKILMSNAFEATAWQIVAWYDLRWQIELFFKECKGVLGLDPYRLGKFTQVEGWVELCLSAFCYLEWYRARQLLRDDLSPEERQRWLHARAHDLCLLVRRRLEQEGAEAMIEMMQTEEGRAELAAALRDACPGATRSPGAA
jgi:hypothetical protein